MRQQLMHVQAGLPDPTNFPEDLLKRREEERQFLTQLLDGSKVQQYDIPVAIKAELRKYQQEGVNWLAFLAKYQLHGILCDGEWRAVSTEGASSLTIICRHGSRQDAPVDLHPGWQAL